MGILDAISDSIYSATYNADADKAKKEEQANAEVVREEITKLLKEYDEKSYEWDAHLNRHIIKLCEQHGTWADVLE